MMPLDTITSSEECNCFAVRAAARHVTQSYDQFLAPTGLRPADADAGKDPATAFREMLGGCSANSARSATN
jgi:hypothetical protein